MNEARLWTGSSELLAVPIGPGTIVEVYSEPVRVDLPGQLSPVWASVIHWQFFEEGRHVARAVNEAKRA